MDINILSKNSVKIKGKHAVFIVGMPVMAETGDFSIKTKVAADAVILLSQTGSFNVSKIENSRVILNGPGDYEISGAKISSFNSGDDLIYIVSIDGLKVLFASTESIKKVKEKVNEQEVAILYANSEIDQSILTALEPKAAIFFGEKALEATKALGKDVKPVQKFSVTGDKLPVEMEVVQLDS